MKIGPEFTVTILSENSASVRISEMDCPWVLTQVSLDIDGNPIMEDLPDHGDAEWPEDADIAASISQLVGRDVVVCGHSGGEDLLESIYSYY